jgi:CheY-like chemotaxis protein
MEESNRYKSQFLANVSHELRTPLNSILLLSKMMSDSEGSNVTAEQRRQALIIYEAGKDLLTLIDDILDLSRIEAREVHLRLEPVHLSRMLDGLVDLVRPQSDAKGLYLRQEIADGPSHTIISDGEKLRQILKNFLVNAIKFTDQGGIRIRLEANTAKDQDQRPVRISVTDTGIGIPEEKHAVIFEAFKQADGSTSRRYGGTGLGLTISRELAGLLGGRIELESKDGQGTTFSLLLPLRPADANRQEKPLMDVDTTLAPDSLREDQAPAPAEQVPIPPSAFSGRRVLVVDDDIQSLLALTPLLERYGLDVTAAADGVEALETLREEGDFELVMVNIMMPGMNGHDTIRRIRDEAQFQNLPILALSAAVEEGMGNSLAAGADELLALPLEPARLQEALTRYLPLADEARQMACS